MGDLDRKLAAVAAQRHSFITLDDVLAAGGTADQAVRRVRAGRWERWARGVYRIAGAPLTWEDELFGAVLAAGPGAIVSHLCAARLLGIGFAKAMPELSIPRGRRHRPPNVRVHESTDLDRSEVRMVDGIPVTDPDRTLLDLGRYLRHPSLRRAVEAARRQDLVTWQSLVRCLVAHARRGRPGVTRLREVIAAGITTDEVTDTDSELIALTLLREHGFPEPVLHHQIRDAEGALAAELDFAYPERKAGLEIDGLAHLDPAVKQKDEERDHYLRGLGWTIRRVWYLVPLEKPKQLLQVTRSLLEETQPR